MHAESEPLRKTRNRLKTEYAEGKTKKGGSLRGGEKALGRRARAEDINTAKEQSVQLAKRPPYSLQDAGRN